MTERRDESQRVDLGALAPTDAQADRVIGAVMARLDTRRQVAPSHPDVLDLVGRNLPPAWIAAAAVVAIATSVTVAVRGGGGMEVTSLDTTVATWAAQDHVPTNAELLLVFQGYQR